MGEGARAGRRAFGASGVEVYAASGYKHLLGPYGCGAGLFSPAALARRGRRREAAPNNLMPLAEPLRLLIEATPARRSHVLRFRARTPHETARAHERLLAAKVYTSLRGDRIRVSPHLYNGPEDADRLLEALR